jgi:hypothetical protein
MLQGVKYGVTTAAPPSAPPSPSAAQPQGVKNASPPGVVVAPAVTGVAIGVTRATDALTGVRTADEWGVAATRVSAAGEAVAPLVVDLETAGDGLRRLAAAKGDGVDAAAAAAGVAAARGCPGAALRLLVGLGVDHSAGPAAANPGCQPLLRRPPAAAAARLPPRAAAKAGDPPSLAAKGSAAGSVGSWFVGLVGEATNHSPSSPEPPPAPTATGLPISTWSTSSCSPGDAGRSSAGLPNPTGAGWRGLAALALPLAELGGAVAAWGLARGAAAGVRLGLRLALLLLLVVAGVVTLALLALAGVTWGALLLLAGVARAKGVVTRVPGDALLATGVTRASGVAAPGVMA